MSSAKYGLNGPIKQILSTGDRGSLKNKFAFSDHSFTRLAAAWLQDSMSHGQKSWIYFTFPHWIFCLFLDNVLIIVNKICFQKEK